MRPITELISLKGRVALITGGAGHIGRAIGDAFEELGAHVVVADRQAPTGTTAAAGRRWLDVDLRVEAATRALVPAVIGQSGRLDILVHCAAYLGDTAIPGWSAPLAEQTVAAWDEAFRVNLTAAFALTQEARAPLTQSGRGSVIFVSSIYGVTAPDPALYAGTSMQNPAAYGASKAALNQLARHLATHYAPAIRVNTITPGGIARNYPDAFVQRYVGRTPLARMGTEEDVKGAAAYLASDMSAYVTGQNLVVDGGWTVWYRRAARAGLGDGSFRW
jgi:NAD(P)-dependent dehydrogenase (short-subunit alcohol dehydrogenase family)